VVDKGISKIMNSEKGQILPLVMVALAVGSVVVTPFIGHAGSSLIGSRVYGQVIAEQYSADSGIEHGIWRLIDDGLAEELSSSGDSITYQLGEAVNGETPSVTVTRDMENIAGDDFESGGWSGGSGWLSGWYHEGDASIVTIRSPYQGIYHLQLRTNNGYVERAVDLSSYSSASLQFRAKARSFESGEEAYCLVSADGTDWTVVQNWRDGDDDNIYRFYEIDLSSYELSSEFRIAFQADMSGTGDQLYIDDLKIVNVFTGAALGLPCDNFESGGWSGGTGWLSGWYYEGASGITTADSPYEGSYHLRMRRGNSYVDRAADLSGETGLRLQFWAKVRGFEGSDYMECLVSPDDDNWTTVYTWASADSDNTYHFYDIDLSSFTMSDEYWVAFQSGMNNKNDYFYVDDLKITTPFVVYQVASTAGDRTIKAIVKVSESTVSVISWQVE
jgi:hypothetical protein